MNGMSPQEFQNYLGLLSRFLRLRATERETIEEELRSHLEERLAALTAEGVEPARAVSLALAEFGDAAALAAEFTAVSRLYKRRWIMRLSIGSIAACIIIAAVLISYWPGGALHSPLDMAQAQQTDKAKQTQASTSAAEKLDVNAQTQAKLEKMVDLEIVETPLARFTDHMAEITGTQFYLDKKVLSEAGVTPDTLITFKLKNVPAEMILRLVFRDLGLTYYLDNGVLIVTTPEEAETKLETRVYRVDDLVDSPLIAKTQETANIFFAKKQNKVSYIDRLIDLLISTVCPTTWDVIGGPGSISKYRGTLVISQTSQVHREIQKLLNDLRQSINKEIEDEDITQPASGDKKDGGRSGGRSGSGGGGFF